MKVISSVLANVVLATVLLTSLFLVGIGMNSNVEEVIAEAKVYDPWSDLNDDGVISIKDLVHIISLYGTYGEPINKTALLLELQSRVEALEAKIPNGVHVTNFTVKLSDGVTDGRVQIELMRYSFDGYMDKMAIIWTSITGTAENAILDDDTILYPEINYQNYIYLLSLGFTRNSPLLCLNWIVVEYEYPQ